MKRLRCALFALVSFLCFSCAAKKETVLNIAPPKAEVPFIIAPAGVYEDVESPYVQSAYRDLTIAISYARENNANELAYYLTAEAVGYRKSLSLKNSAETALLQSMQKALAENGALMQERFFTVMTVEKIDSVSVHALSFSNEGNMITARMYPMGVCFVVGGF